MARIACFTSFTYAYLARARVLAESLRRLHPDWSLTALVTDRPPPNLPATALDCFDHVQDAAALGIPDFPAWLFKHDLVEACTAVKATMLRRLLERGAEKVIYLDPDIAAFAPLTPLVDRLDAASLLLTPHQLAPDTTPEQVRDNEGGSLRYGIYNLGFLGVRNDPTGRAFAAWWEERLHAACYDAPEAGIFTDQKYCDLVPGLFPGVHITRDPGCNVASWNIARRPVRITPRGEVTAAGRLLRFYHFTKIAPEGARAAGDTMTERHAGENYEIHELVAWYKRAIAAAELPEAAGHPWHYASFADGTAIPRAARLLWRDRADLRRAFADPFHPAQYRAWLAAHQPATLGIEPPASDTPA
ncbi:MAG: hypothetical protein IT555_21620 [Acetobacteraceae bacterium]|nr:hypothetical protein [Acetobacteraceae bacterium]